MVSELDGFEDWSPVLSYSEHSRRPVDLNGEQL